MSQATYSIGSGQTGTAYRNADNSGKQAIVSGHKGSSAPSYAIAGIEWIDDSSSPWVKKIYDGTDWITMGTVDATSNIFTPANVQTISGSTNYAADAQANDTYVITLSPAPTAYAAGNVFRFKANTANTGACTLNVNSLGAKTLKKVKDGALADLDTGDIIAGQIVEVVYDGTHLQVMSPGQVSLLGETLTEQDTLEDTDRFIFGDDSDSGRLKYIEKSDLAASLGSGLPTRYHGGQRPVYATAATFTVASIRARNSDDDGDIVKTTSTTVTVSSTGLNGCAQSSNLTGTIACSGTTVTGTSTTFSSDFAVGDVIWSTTESTGRRITAIASNTSLTVESSWTITSGTNYRRGGEAPSTTYYLYAITDGTTPGLILSQRNVAGGGTLTDLPSGYTKSRQLRFSVRNDSSSNLIPWHVADWGECNTKVLYNCTMSTYGDTAGPTNVFNGTSPTSWTEVSLASYVPAISRLAILHISYYGTSQLKRFRPMGETHNGVGFQGTTASGSPVGQIFDLATNSSQSIQHIQESIGDAADLNVFGFYVTEVP